jgi:uncharacterized membrane protein
MLLLQSDATDVLLVMAHPGRSARESFMITSRTRLAAAAIAQCFAVIVFFTMPRAFSGNAQRYVGFVASQIAHAVLAGGLMGFALVVSVPVCWRGNKWQRLTAAVLIAISVLVFAVPLVGAYGRTSGSSQ